MANFKQAMKWMEDGKRVRISSWGNEEYYWRIDDKFTFDNLWCIMQPDGGEACMIRSWVESEEWVIYHGSLHEEDKDKEDVSSTLCECGHRKKFHPQGVGGCFYTKSESNVVSMDDVDCSCNKFKPQDVQDTKSVTEIVEDIRNDPEAMKQAKSLIAEDTQYEPKAFKDEMRKDWVDEIVKKGEDTIREELEDYCKVADTFSKVLDRVTKGKMSKPNYTWEAIEKVLDEVVEEENDLQDRKSEPSMCECKHFALLHDRFENQCQAEDWDNDLGKYINCRCKKFTSQDKNAPKENKA